MGGGGEGGGGRKRKGEKKETQNKTENFSEVLSLSSLLFSLSLFSSLLTDPRRGLLAVDVVHHERVPEIREDGREDAAGVGADKGDRGRGFASSLALPLPGAAGVVEADRVGRRRLGQHQHVAVLQREDLVGGQRPLGRQRGHVHRDVELRQLCAARLGPVLAQVGRGQVEVGAQVAGGRWAVVVEDDGLDAGEDDVFGWCVDFLCVFLEGWG